MDDTAAGIAIGALALMLLHGIAYDKAKHSAEREIRLAFSDRGSIRATIREEGPFGLFANDVHALDVYGDGVSADRLPLVRIPKTGWKGRINHVRLHLTNVTIAGVQAASVETDIRGVTFDIGHALYKGRLVVRDSGSGPISITLTRAMLKAYIEHKYSKSLSHISTEMDGDKFSMSGDIVLISSPTPFRMSGRAAVTDSSKIELDDCTITLNNKPIDATGTRALLAIYNPILDIEKDFHLGNIMKVSRVHGSGDAIVIEGIANIPLEANSPPRHLTVDVTSIAEKNSSFTTSTPGQPITAELNRD